MHRRAGGRRRADMWLTDNPGHLQVSTDAGRVGVRHTDAELNVQLTVHADGRCRPHHFHDHTSSSTRLLVARAISLLLTMIPI